MDESRPVSGRAGGTDRHVVPYAGDTSTDWYRAFAQWDARQGDRYLDGTDGGSFAWGPAGYVQRSYLNLYRAFGETAWLDRLVDQIDRVMAARSDEPPYEHYDPRYVDGYKGWGQNRYSQYAPEYTEWFCDDGLIISPILAFVELVWDDPRLHAAYKSRADAYIRIVEQDVIAKWYDRWDPDPGWTATDNTRYREDRGYHLYEWSGWRNQPLNMYLSFTDALITLGRLSSSPLYEPVRASFPAFYAEQSRRMMQYFRDQLVLDPDSDAYVWSYGSNSRWPELIEDVGHAFIDIQAALQGVRSGLAFDDDDLRRLGNTLVHRVWNGSLSDPTFRYYVDGKASKYDEARGHWGWGFLYLAGHDYRIWEAMAAYYEAHITLADHGSNIAAGAAMLSLAAQEHDVWPPGSPRHLEITREGDGLRLRWERPDADADGTPLTGLQGYFVYRATDRDGPYERLHDQPVTSAGYQDSYASERGSWYRVTAVDYRRPPNEGPPCEPVGWDPPRKH